MTADQYIAQATELCGSGRHADYLAFAEQHLREVMPLLTAEQLDYLCGLGEVAAEVVDAEFDVAAEHASS
jgi:hypothetical protein